MPMPTCAHGSNPRTCPVPHCTGVAVSSPLLSQAAQKLLKSNRAAIDRHRKLQVERESREKILPVETLNVVKKLSREMTALTTTKSQQDSINIWDDVVITGGGRLDLKPPTEHLYGVLQGMDTSSRWQYRVECKGVIYCLSREDFRKATKADQNENKVESIPSIVIPETINNWPSIDSINLIPAEEITDLSPEMQHAAIEYASYTAKVMNISDGLEEEVRSVLRQQKALEFKIRELEKKILLMSGTTLYTPSSCDVMSTPLADEMWYEKQQLRSDIEQHAKQTKVLELLVAKMSLNLMSKSSRAPALSPSLQNSLLLANSSG